MITKAKVELPNIHPADELSSVREEIALLTKRADVLRALLLAEGASLEGDQYTAVIVNQKRETLDRKALEDTFGKKAIEPFLKTTHYKVVNLSEKA